MDGGEGCCRTARGNSFPRTVRAFNPMKLYTSKELVDFVRDRGKNLVVLWDDFKLYDRATTQ